MKKANLIEIPFDASTTLSGSFRLNGLKTQGWVVGNPVSSNPGLKFLLKNCSSVLMFCFGLKLLKLQTEGQTILAKHLTQKHGIKFSLISN